MTERPQLVRFLAHPVTCLLVLGLVVWAGALEEGWLVPERTYDTVSYEWPSGTISFAEHLQNLRTFGYPLFLKAYGSFFDDYAFLPTLHLLVYFAAVLLFWFGVRSYSGSGWRGFAAAAPLMAPCVLPWVRQVQPELMAPALAVSTIGLLFLLATRPRSASLWIALTVSALATYHMRPAYVFLVLLLPPIGFVLRVGIESRRWRRFAWALVASSLLPLLAYCGLRFAVVGHFGLVNFDGYELLGIAACMLDAETAAAMPGEHRELAQRILRQRNRRGWSKYTLESDSKTFFDQYGRNQWFIGEPLARKIVMRERRLYRHRWGEHRLPISPLEARQIDEAERMPPLAGELAQTLNSRLGDFSKWLIVRHPALYLKWVGDGFRYGLGRFGACRTVRWLGIGLAVSLSVLFLRRRSGAPVAEPEASRRRRVVYIYGLILLGVGFLVGKLALMVLVSWPWDRYLFAALLFLPTALGASLFEVWASLLRSPER